MSKILHLNLKEEYFNEIKDRTKPLEYRLGTPYWRKRLIDREYEEVRFKLGYPKSSEHEKIVKRKYRGYTMRAIRHKIFGNEDPSKKQVVCFAIDTTGEDIK